MVVVPLKNLQDTELRINRTRTIHYRDSNLQDTSRNHRDRAATIYNPDCKKQL